MATERQQYIEYLLLELNAPMILDTIETVLHESDTSSTCSSSSDSSDAFENDLEIIARLQAAIYNRYLHPRDPIPRAASQLELCLGLWKERYHREFRRYARMDPDTFDSLVSTIRDADVFQNRSHNEQQMPVDRQLLIALVQFGTYGNGASLDKIADIAGVGKGTVDLVTRRVIVAVRQSKIREKNIRWPVGQDREDVKQMVEDQTEIHGFRNGWCMVDGTLVPLFQKPAWFGETFFDRKSNYSMNIQIINTPDRRIIDYASGFRGTVTDSKAFRFTRLGREHEVLLAPDEWCWGDQGYQLYRWLMIPYKQPVREDSDNAAFNYHLSTIRIFSEHTIGYLKGRFQSLKELRVQIHTKEDFIYATCWINTCIALHAFCQADEVDEQSDFIEDGVAHEREQRRDERRAPAVEQRREREVTLADGRQRREELKNVLVRELDN
jgi:hypothetical protein